MLLYVFNTLWQTVLINGLSFSPNVLLELSFAWIFNEYPSFVVEDHRRFVSQETGHLYIAKVEPSDVGNYTCVVTSAVTTTSELGSPTPLVLRPDGRTCSRCSPEWACCGRSRNEGRGPCEVYLKESSSHLFQNKNKL